MSRSRFIVRRLTTCLDNQSSKKCWSIVMISSATAPTSGRSWSTRALPTPPSLVIRLSPGCLANGLANAKNFTFDRKACIICSVLQVPRGREYVVSLVTGYVFGIPLGKINGSRSETGVKAGGRTLVSS